MSDVPTVPLPLWDLLAEAHAEDARNTRTLAHATRALYQRGCRCLACCAAEASYRRALYRARALGKPTLGQTRPAGVMHRRLEALRREGFSVEDIARQARLHPRTLYGHHRRVRLRTYLAVAALYRRHCGEL